MIEPKAKAIADKVRIEMDPSSSCQTPHGLFFVAQLHLEAARQFEAQLHQAIKDATRWRVQFHRSLSEGRAR